MNASKSYPTSLKTLYRRLLQRTADVVRPDDVRLLRSAMTAGYADPARPRADNGTPLFDGLDPALHTMATAVALCDTVAPDRNMLIATLLHDACRNGSMTPETVGGVWGDDVAMLTRGLLKVDTLYGRGAAATDPDTFRELLLTFAEDIRVIIIMIVDRLMLMRAINHHPDEESVRKVAAEVSYLYAPLAHRLGLYAVKGELEDLALKYTQRDIYTRIARKLNATKAARDAYIAAFIGPVKNALEEAGIKFDIKGRTKSISSIWNKMRKQGNDLDHIYDLFAIRVIIDVPLQRERSECWLAYSIITDMYRPNPARLKDWLSIPKSNGYESLHITVMGPEGRWVEVQIRTRRMDMIAEKGVAAHWKYKGIKSEANLDTWMNQVREILESGEGGPSGLIRNSRTDLYNKEVYAFTPKGDLYKLPQGATVLDFAFNIHSGLGCRCIGAKIDGKPRRINQVLRNGDTVEIMTSTTQQPKADWLNMVVTGKARSKIRSSLKEQAAAVSDTGKELLQRRLKNRKTEIDEPTMMRIIKRLGYKNVTDFYAAIGSEQLDPARVMAEAEAMRVETEIKVADTPRSAGEFTLQERQDDEATGAPSGDVLVIGSGDVRGLNYKLSRCCGPIPGDPVFGFISSEGVVKVHRQDCPNAANLRLKYPYRVVPVRWSGMKGGEFQASLRIVGADDIGIVTNITSIINKHSGCMLRNISIDSHDGIFQGYLVVGVPSTDSLATLIKKIKTVKGVKEVQRNN